MSDSPYPFHTWQESDDRSNDDVAYIYWILLAVASLAPVVIFIIIIARRPAILQMLRSPLRYRSYGLRQLERHGEPKYTLCYFFLYRHRPMLMDFFKVAVEFAFIANFFGQGVTVRAPLITWCLYDVMAFVHMINLKDLKRRPGSGQGAPLAFWIYMVYTVAFGFPMGTVTKVLWIFHVKNGLLFHYVLLPYYFGSAGLVLFIVFFLIPYTCVTSIRRNSTVQQFTNRMYLILFFFCVGITWAWTFLNVEFCGVPSALTNKKTWFDDDNCPASLDTYTAAFLPISLMLVVFNIYLSYMTTRVGLLWRFMPEVVTMWAVAITFLTSMYHMDKGDNRILFAGIMVLGLSGIITLMCNMSLIYIVIYTVRYVIPLREQEIAAGRRSRHFTEEQKKKNRETRETMLANFLKSKGKSLDGANMKTKAKVKNEKKKPATLKGTLFRQMWVQSKDQMSRCCICFEDYSGDKDEIYIAIIKKCGHYFHYECVWDWLEKRPTCPMCRQPVGLDETGIQVLSYFDIKHAIRVNRPTDGDAQSIISSISGLTGNPKQETSALDEGSKEGNESNVGPPVSLRPIIEAAKTQSNPGSVNSGSSKVSKLDRGPLPPVPSTQKEKNIINRPLPPVSSTHGENDNVTPAVDDIGNVENGHQVASQALRQKSEHLGHVTTAEINHGEGRRGRRTSESSRGRDKYMRPTGEHTHRHTTHQQERSRDRHHHGDHHFYQHHQNEQPPHHSDAKTPSEGSRSHYKQRHRQQQQPAARQPGQHRRPSSEPQMSHVTPPPDTPHARGKRQSRRRCEICGGRYEGDPRDIVVGYIRGCGHFYHCLCLDSYIRKHETCPRCHYEAKNAKKRGQTPQPERRVTFNEIFLVFLLDILHEADADTADSTVAHSNGVGTRWRNNRGYVAEIQRF